MASEKQALYIRSMMIDHGLVNGAHNTFYGAAKMVPHGPTMAQRRGKFQEWADGLTIKGASEVIAYLREKRRDDRQGLGWLREAREGKTSKK